MFILIIIVVLWIARLSWFLTKNLAIWLRLVPVTFFIALVITPTGVAGEGGAAIVPVVFVFIDSVMSGLVDGFAYQDPTRSHAGIWEVIATGVVWSVLYVLSAAVATIRYVFLAKKAKLVSNPNRNFGINERFVKRIVFILKQISVRKTFWSLTVLFLFIAPILFYRHFFGEIKQPDSANSYIVSGRAKQAKGDWESALADYNKAIELKPNYAETYVFRGIALEATGRLFGGLPDYNKAIELKPEYVEAYYYRGLDEQEKQDWDEAIADYAKVIELKPNLTPAYFNRWEVKNVSELRLNYSFVYRGRGDAKKSKNDLDGAIADYTKSIEIMPDSFYAYSTYFARSDARKSKGDLDGALADQDKAVALKASRQK